MTSVDTYPDASWPNILGNSGGCAWKELKSSFYTWMFKLKKTNAVFTWRNIYRMYTLTNYSLKNTPKGSWYNIVCDDDKRKIGNIAFKRSPTNNNEISNGNCCNTNRVRVVIEISSFTLTIILPP